MQVDVEKAYEEQQMLEQVSSDIQEKVSSLVEMGEDELGEYVRRRREEIADEQPFIYLHDCNYDADDITLQLVPVGLIVGGVNVSFKHWGFEPNSQDKRGIHHQIVHKLVDAVRSKFVQPVKSAINSVFYISSRGSESGIQLLKVPGIIGFSDVYFVRNGTHRTSIAKLLRLENIPAFVTPIRNPKRLTVGSSIGFDKYLEIIGYWNGLDRTGLVDLSEITSGKSFGNLSSSCEVLSEPALPWLVLCQTIEDLVELNKIYERENPGALDNIRNPKDGKQITKKVLLNVRDMKEYLGI